MSLRAGGMLLAALFLAAPASAQVRSCAPLLQNVFVRDTLSDFYLWYRELPTPKVTAFDSPQAYLEAVRYKPLDTTFSYITSRAANDAFYSASQFVGFGFSTSLTAANELRVTEVFPFSPAHESGIGRGDRVLEIDGRAMPAIISGGGIANALGPASVGVARELLVDHAGALLRVRLVKRVVTIPTVSLTRTFDVNGRRVGYLFFRDFVEPSVAALDTAFAQLRAQGITELVVDLRYNGGGLVSVAQQLASLIGGARTNGQVFADYVHNDRQQSKNHTLRFEQRSSALSLNRVFVITTRASASASELVINALRPFMPVVQIGDRTYGKPVGQYAFTFCDKVLAAVSFSLNNANGEGSYFDGLMPTCAASDSLDFELGDARESSLREALAFVTSETCSTTSSTRATPATVRERPGDGWEALVGAH